MILAGGRASRLGGVNKSMILFDGRTIISRSLETLQPLFPEVILAGWPEGESIPEGVKFVPDNFPGAGPLAGIEAAMAATGAEAIFVFAGDMPQLSSSLITMLADAFISGSYTCLVPRHKGKPEPLHALYSTALLPDLKRFISHGSGLSVKKFMESAGASYLDTDDSEGETFVNINTPGDLLL